MDPRDFMAGLTELALHQFYDGLVLHVTDEGLVVGPVQDTLDTKATKKLRSLGWRRLQLQPDIWLAPLEIHHAPKKPAPVAPGAIDSAGPAGRPDAA